MLMDHQNLHAAKKTKPVVEVYIGVDFFAAHKYLSFIMDYVTLSGLMYRAEGEDILRGINAGFAANKITAIIGRSGSGKSTLLKLIIGLLKPSEGFIVIDGERIDYGAVRSLRRKIGYSVQEVGLFPHLTARENISLPGKVHGNNTAAAERTNELARLTNFSHELLDRYPHQLSGGERQRVAISRALFLNPPLLLMDESFGSLDPVTRYDVHNEFLQLQKLAPRTVLLVTHDLREATKLADDILVLEQGTVQQFGSPQSILERPATEMVKNLLRTAGL
jgi:osmoprotectant transport system ATP-binding protein